MMRFLLFFLLSTFGFSPAFAGGINPDSTTVYGGVKSSYVISNAVVSSKASVFQGGVTFTWGQNYIDLWGSHPLHDADLSQNQFGKEIDITVGHRGEVGDAKFLVGLAHFNLYPTSNMDGSDVLELFGEISPKSDWHSMSPYLRVEVMSTPAYQMDKAVASYVGVRNNITISDDWKFDQQLQLSHQPKNVFVGAGNIGYYKAGITRTIGKGSVGFSFEHYQPMGMDAGRTVRNVGGANFAYVF